MKDLPVGFLMALAENEQAMERYAGLTEQERCQVKAQARQAGSREEMQAIVRGLG